MNIFCSFPSEARHQTGCEHRSLAPHPQEESNSCQGSGIIEVDNKRFNSRLLTKKKILEMQHGIQPPLKPVTTPGHNLDFWPLIPKPQLAPCPTDMARPSWTSHSRCRSTNRRCGRQPDHHTRRPFSSQQYALQWREPGFCRPRV